MRQPCVLHICGDYPDAFRPNKTPVVMRLVEGLSVYARNIVISINRVNNPMDEAVRKEGNIWAIQYFAPALGFMQSTFLDRLARRLAGLLEEAELSPDMAIGHKFTIEGYLCWKLWHRLDIPYIACFMGNTDSKIFRVKPHYRKIFRNVAQEAKALVFPTPWCSRLFTKDLLQPAGIPENRAHLIPYISVETLSPIRSSPVNARRFVTICRLDIWRLKNLHRLIKAIAILNQSDGDWSLDIIGPGSPAAQTKLTDLISSHALDQKVHLLGERSREQINSLLPGYCAMVMPSYPESFGLVYLEALERGVPIMTARGAGMDGFFPDQFPGVVVAHDQLEDIAQGLRTLSEKSKDFRERIQTIASEFRQFDRQSIISNYARLLELKEDV